jgi:DNA invertase Pin-like site-specific DNA recombinase
MMIGYCRVSTEDQSLDLQRDALEKAGCGKIFSDVASGGLDSRKGLNDAIEFARSGDTICVWKLDRLGRSLRHLIETINYLSKQGVELRSLQEALDTRTPGGKLLFHVMGALAEFERSLIQERTRAGLEAARARGRIGGRPTKLGPEEVQMAKTLLAEGRNGVGDVAKLLKVSRSTVYRHLEES